MVKTGIEHVKLKDHFRSLKLLYALLISHRQQWNDIKNLVSGTDSVLEWKHNN